MGGDSSPTAEVEGAVLAAREYNTEVVLVGDEKPTEGTLAAKTGLKIGYVPQMCEFPAKTAAEILFSAIKTDIPDYEKEHAVETWLSKFGFTGN